MTEQEKADLKTIKNIQAKFKKAINEYGLIADNDHILVGLSGGKDSLALVELLSERSKIFVPRFKVTAAHITVSNISYESDLLYLENFCQQHGVDFVHRATSFDMDQDPTKSTCFLCSWHRRKKLFAIAEELGCNKIALGHHMDDMVETLLLNLVYQGALASMPALLKMEKFDMQIIRPLALLTENEIRGLEKIRDYKQQKKACPYEKDSSRSDAKALVQMLEKWNPDVRKSLMAAMDNIKHDYLPRKVNHKEL